MAGSKKTHRSYRCKFGADYDADAYFLERGDWLVFAYVKSATKAWSDICAEITRNFERGELTIIAGSRKTKDGSEPLPPVTKGGGKVPDFVWAYEGGVQFRLETKDVLNPGLFLDQEQNRVRLGEILRGLSPDGKPLAGTVKLLNLFSYTGAFSVVANCLGVETTSVDVSGRYLEWEKRNQGQNAEIKKPEWGDRYPAMRLLREDARTFVRRALTRKERYEIIILDPPTFSKSDGEVFKVSEHLIPLAEECLKILEPKTGRLFISTNDGQWAPADFYREIEALAKSHEFTTERGVLPEEFAQGDPKYPLKSAWIHRG